jgi:FemAB-related protein (PEP-CTERM system-associated)
MRLLLADNSLATEWDKFVAPKTANVTDLFGWSEVVSDTYGIRRHLMMAEDNGQIYGALALYEVRHPLFGNYLTTAPFATDGGFYFESSATREFLIREANALADRKNVRYLLIRTRGIELEGFAHDHHYRTAVIDLTPGNEALWMKTLNGKTRNQVRRGKKEGFEVSSGDELWLDFYRVFTEHMRDLGSPAHSKLFYQNIRKHLSGYVKFIVIKEDETPVGGAMLFEINGTATNLHTVALRKYNRRCPNYLLYWEMIKGSCERGNHSFDMGRSEENSPNLKFKQNWGPDVKTLNYEYLLKKDTEIPYLDPRNPRYRLPIAAWKKLPVSVSNRIGPWLIRGIA